MDGAGEAMVAVVCDDRRGFRESVVRLLMATGFVVPAVTEIFGELAEAELTQSARVAVIALPLTGMTGLEAVRALRARAPECEVVLLSASATPAPAAVAAGARALVPEDDLRALRAVLLQLVATPAEPRLPRARDYPGGVNGSVSRNPSS